MLIYSYINTSGNWENEKLCGNTTPEGLSVFTQFRVFPISTSVDITVYQYEKNVLYLFYSMAQRNIKKEIFRRFRVDIQLYYYYYYLFYYLNLFYNGRPFSELRLIFKGPLLN